MTKAASTHIEALTGFRTLAAAAVFFHHAIVDRRLDWPMTHLYVGYLLFFVLSGFLICLHNAEKAQFSTRFFKVYWVKRFARIYPVYLLIFLLTLGLTPQWFDSPLDWKFLFLNLTLLKAWSHDYIYSGIGQAWTLTIEETFYLLAPFLFLARRRGMPLFLWAVAFQGLGWGWYHLGQSLVPALAWDLYGLTMSLFFFLFSTFAFGIFFAEIFLGLRPRAQGWLTRVKTPTWIGLLLMVVAVTLLELDKPGPSLAFHFSWVQFVVTLGLLPLGTGLFLYGLAIEKTFIRQFLSSRPLVILGKSSYVFYLIHYGVLAALVDRTLETFGVSIPLSTYFQFVILQCLALVIYSFYEEPLAKWLRRLGQGSSI